MSTEANKETVRAFTEALGERDWERWASLLDEQFSWTMMAYELPGAGTLDRDSALALLPEILAGFADDSPRMALGSMIAEGDWVAVEAEGTGSFANGTPYRNRYSIHYEIVAGRVRTIREYMDTGHMASMLSAAQQ